MFPTIQKEQFANAHLRAIAAAAGFSVSKPEVDDESIDFIIKGRERIGLYPPQLDVQLKCTSSWTINPDNEIPYPLELKNYDDLRIEEVLTPRLLILVTVPNAVNDWVTHDIDFMLLKHTCYWLSLRGEPETTNTTQVTVYLPVENQLTVDTLQQIMAEVSKTGVL